MRHESIAIALAVVLLAGCGPKEKIIRIDNDHGPRADAKLPPRELSNSGSINLGLAQTYLQAGELETAMDRANRALASDPNSGNVHAMLGLIHDRIGDQGRAAAAFGRAIELSPTSGSVLNAYGSWLCAHGDVAGAAQQFSRALADPFFTSPGLAHYNSGQCLLRAKQPAAAETALRRALDAPGADLGAVLLALAQVSLEQGKVLEARAFVQRREAMGATPDVLELAARIEDAAGDAMAAARYRSRLQGVGGKQP